jgi:hypothetical protein
MSQTPDLCCCYDYLVVGGGATGLAFCDSLLNSTTSTTTILLIDVHDRPGGQWNDSYKFVELHQPSSMYGVKSTKLEEEEEEPFGESCTDTNHRANHRAKREEILDYYLRLVQEWTQTQHPFGFEFRGSTKYDFTSNKVIDMKTDQIVDVKYKTLVDARYLQPDLPIDTPPKFTYDQRSVKVIPVNDLMTTATSRSTVTANTTTVNYVIVGSGKTGMDAILYLLERAEDDHDPPPQNIMWIVPSDAWITARENMGNCIQFLHDSLTMKQQQQQQQNDDDDRESSSFIQDTFLEWEKQGKVYRLFNDKLPTKFRDATLSKDELVKIQTAVQNGTITIVRGHGRLLKIHHNSGNGNNNDSTHMEFVDGTVVALPWTTTKSSTDETLFVHCSAGAFHYTKQTGPVPKVFQPNRIVINDIYGTPGFCFNGAFIGYVETLQGLSDDEKNDLVDVESDGDDDGGRDSHGTVDIDETTKLLGPSGGNVDITLIQGYAKRLSNLRKWIHHPEICDWLVHENRLFNLGSLTKDQLVSLVETTYTQCKDLQVL